MAEAGYLKTIALPCQGYAMFISKKISMAYGLEKFQFLAAAKDPKRCYIRKPF
jgi:hypothetical protein